MKKPKLVHIIQSLRTGGAENILVSLAINCKEQFDVTVISQYPEANLPYEKRLIENGIKVVFQNKKRGLDLNNALELYQLLNQIQPDILHTHLHAAVYAIPWYIKHKKCVKIHTVHTIAHMEFPTAHKIAQAIAYRYLHVMPIAISSAVKKSIITQYHITPERIPLITNSVQVKKYTPLTNKVPSSSFTVINVASFYTWKNQILLLEAFYNAVLEKPNMKLIFVGDGNERQNVTNRAIELGIGDKVNFVGITDKVEMYLHKADVFALSSTFEGLSLAILEAYAAGLPVIATNVGGVPDILADGINGLLVPLNDVTAFKNAILKLYSDPDLRKKMSCENQIKVKDYDIEQTTKKYIALYLKNGEAHEAV
ncbi:MAG: glycosyltransferase family 4 protein [Clostridiaceae bacterium]|jgi:glycosyltransferase involved in cell wall biosynthesis|nr:glycosyltransferase family 4 protein [Clostridiaceae bacterium]